MTKYVPGMLTCKEVDSFLYDFHQGKLTYVEKIKFTLHLSMCRECQAYVQSYKNTIRMSQSAFIRQDPVEKIPEELIDVILKSRAKH
jgi:predicted anti-sigma-YlaC factor YlaD